MREVLLEATPASSTRNVALYVLASLGLIAVGVVFAYGVFTEMTTLVLGALLSAGFGLLAVVLLLYFRIGFPHRIVLETGEELW